MPDRPDHPIPRPGQPVRGSRTGQPIMVLLDLLGRRWALGVLWQLHQGACTFRELQDRCESISPSVLNSRLKDLRAAHLVDRNEDGYHLTDQGRALFDLIEPVGAWAKAWVRDL